MATTIVTKKGSGAPAASDLVEGELAVDTTNGRLYTENSSAAVVELGSNPSGNITFGDNGKAIFGAGSDLQIYHHPTDGSFIVDNGTGNLQIDATDFRVRNTAGTEAMIHANADGAVKLFYNGTATPKLATTATGIDVTGTVTSGDITIAVDDTPTLNFKKASSADILGTINVTTDAGSGGKMVFQTKRNGDTALDRMTIDDGGNVGIGGGTISSKLFVNTDTVGDSYFKGGADNSRTLSFSTFATASPNAGHKIDATSINGQIAFAINGGEAMRIDSSGNVGIGTASGEKRLHIYDSTSANQAIRFGNPAGTPYGEIQYDPSGFEHLYIRSKGTTTGYGNIVFETGSTPTEAMRINSDGKVDVGGVANQTTAVLNARFNGAAIEFGHANNSAGYYGTAGSYGNNGHPYIGFSCDGEESANTFTTRGAKGNIITGDLSGNLTFAQVTTASATGQTPVSRMTLNASGNLGIGTSSPSNLLALKSGTNTDMEFGSESGGGFIQTYNRTSSAYGYLRFITSSSETMRLDTSSNVLVGLTSTSGIATGATADNGIYLDGANGAVVAQSSANKNFYAAKASGFTDPDFISFQVDGASVGSIGVDSGDNMYIASSATNHVGLYLGGGGILPMNSGALDSGDNVDLGSPNYQFADLYLSGNVLVGGTSSAQAAKLALLNGSSTTALLTLECTHTTPYGAVQFVNGNGIAGSISVYATSVTYNTSSDQRLKENIADADDAGSKVDAIQVRKFDWIADGSHQDYGMVAQELIEVAPEAVSAPEDPEDMMGVDYSKLVPMLVKEIQSLRARVAQLES